MKLARAAVLPLLLCACVGRAPPVPPQAAVTPPPGWRTQAGPTAPIDAVWWTRFGDPVLAQLVEIALANNTDIAIAAARVREARAQEQAARAQLFPTLSGGGGVTYSRSVSPLGTPTTSFGAQPLFEASYE